MNYAELSKDDWRPISFEGTVFPPTVMGISILSSVLPNLDEELEFWLWSFPICKGVIKSKPAEECRRCANRASDLMLDHRDIVLASITERLGSYGFVASVTYRDWIFSLKQIAEIASRTTGECEWSAPALLGEKEKMLEQFELWEKLLKKQGESYFENT